MLVQLLQRNADYRPDDVAIVYGRASLSHAGLLDRVQRCARGLEQLGIGRGERVALFLENSPDLIISFFAVAACGAINVPLSPECKEEELKFYFRDAGVRCVIVDKARIELAKRAASTVPQRLQLIVVGGTMPDAVAFSDLLTHAAVVLRHPQLDDDVVFLYSSGSTGRPKCAPRTVIQYWWETDYMVSTLQLGRDDVIFCAIPLFHNYGLVECVLAAAASGAKLVILETPNPFILRRRDTLRLLETERATVFPGVPFMFRHLADSSAAADLSSLRWCYTAAAVLPPELFKEFFSKFGVQIRQHYGCAEVGAMAINVDRDVSESSTSVGRPFPGVRMKILGEDGKIQPPGQPGAVAVGSRAMTRGYLGKEALNQDAFQDGYFLTGDLGRFDDHGRLYLLGRRKFVIEVVGHKVDPVEVEDVLAEHPNVRESVVIGIPGPAGREEIVKAYVVLDQPCSEQELLGFCRERLANFKVPQAIEPIEAVPKDALGKIVRKQEIIERRRQDFANKAV